MDSVLHAITRLICGHNDAPNESSVTETSESKPLSAHETFLLAISEGDTEKVQSMIQECKTSDEIVSLLSQSEDTWTALQLAAANNHKSIVDLLLNYSAECNLNIVDLINAEGAQGVSSLALAIGNGHESIASKLVTNGGNVSAIISRGRNCVYAMCRDGRADLCRLVIEKHGADFFVKEALLKDSNGFNALHAAALMEKPSTCKLLLSLKVPISATTKDGSNALHLSCRNGKHAADDDVRATMQELLQYAELDDYRVADVFGSTPLHSACLTANVAAVKLLLEKVPIVTLTSQDNDGHHPTHSACQLLVQLCQPHNETLKLEEISKASECIECLIYGGYPIDALDYSEFTIFHVLAVSGSGSSHVVDLLRRVLEWTEKTHGREVVQRIIELEAANGLTCIHLCLKYHNAKVENFMIDLLKSYANSKFLEKFDVNKSESPSKSYRLRCGAHNRIPLEQRRAILNGSHTIEGIASYLQRLSHNNNGSKTPKIVLLFGAGVSTAAGIPDFRSATGIYSNKESTQFFSLEYIISNPLQFYQKVKQLFLPVIDGTIKPTRTHALLRVLKNRGWLKRLYTQNVDLLEYQVLDSEDIVECHGSFKRAYCTNPDCTYKVSDDNNNSSMETEFWAPIRDDSYPTCRMCKSVLRPDVTFFGEPLSTRFSTMSNDDIPDCDCLIVVGTTLLVYPVAAMPQFVNPDCVRLLINREPAGCFQHVPPCTSDNNGSTNGNLWETSMYRDVFFKGNCDDGAIALANALELSNEIESVYNQLQRRI